MTLLEKVMRETKDTRTLDEFIEKACVFSYDYINKHFDGSRAVELCSTKMRAYDKCKQCWLQEYIEDPVYCELVENPDWIQIDEPVYKCTNCENSFVIISKPRSNICFCPHCGKRVELEIPF